MSRPSIPSNSRKTALETQGALAKEGYVSEAYYELPQADDDVADVLYQLSVNIEKLADFQGKLQYILGEVKSLVTKNIALGSIYHISLGTISCRTPSS